VESEKEKDKGATSLPSRSKFEEKREDRKEKKSKTLPPKPYMSPLPFHKHSGQRQRASKNKVKLM